MKKYLAGMVLGLALLGACAAFAQEATNEAAAAETTAPTEHKTTLWTLIKQGGITMYPLGLFSFGMIFFIVQNALALREKVLLRPELLPELIEMMKDKKVLEAHTLCRENETMFTYVFAAGLERCSAKGPINFTKVKEAIDEASTEEITSYLKPIDYLSIIGSIAPLLGLYGTVSGMIKAFQTMGSQGMGKPELLAANIGEALITTAAGLIIAIPSMLFYYYFRNNFIKTTATLGRNIGALLDTLESGELPLGFEHMGEQSARKK